MADAARAAANAAILPAIVVGGQTFVQESGFATGAMILGHVITAYTTYDAIKGKAEAGKNDENKGLYTHLAVLSAAVGFGLYAGGFFGRKKQD